MLLYHVGLFQLITPACLEASGRYVHACMSLLTYAQKSHVVYTCISVPCSILLSDGDSAMGLRELAAGIILSDPDKYNTAILGKTNPEYVDWLLREESWGGTVSGSSQG